MKEQIKDWLKQFGHPREWLAEQTSVSPKTVNNWLSSPQEIPDSKLSLIKRLMADDEAQENARRQKLQPQAQIFSLEVDLPTFRSYSAAALADGKTIEQWSIDELNAAAEQAMANATTKATTPRDLNYLKAQSRRDQEILRVAEDFPAKS